MMFSSAIQKVLMLALVAGSACSAAANKVTFVRQDTRNLVSCSDECTTQGPCSSGQIQVCHEGKENECISPDEWSEHCSDHGDTCGACTTSSSGGGGCFSSTSTLFVRGKGLVSMEEAQIGDMVMTSPGSYESLYAFGHYKTDTKAEFLEIKTTVDTLEVTGEHLMHVVGKHNPVRADSIIVGDSLYSTDGTTQVLKTSTVTSKGLYAPLTPSGKIVVNNVVASSYIALTEADSEKIAIGSWSMAHSDFVHLTLAPFRVFCMGVTDKPCQVYDEEGIAVYIRWGIAIVEAAHNEGAFWGYLLLAIGMPIATMFLAIEWLFGPSFALLAVFSIGVGASFWRKNSTAGKIKTV